MQRCLPDSRKRPRTASGRRATRVRTLLAAQILELRTDAGISLRRLGDAAGIDAGYLQQVEAGLREPSISVLAAIAEALGADLSVRLYPNTGPIVRDHIQARIVEELLRIVHPRWRLYTEVPVYRPAPAAGSTSCSTTRSLPRSSQPRSIRRCGVSSNNSAGRE